MSPALRVVSPGLLTTVQDLGRFGYQDRGIPVSGALDSVSFCAANALVGNAPGAAALEVAYVGPTLAIEAESVRLAFVGAEAPIEILAHPSEMRGRRIHRMRSVLLRRGEIVRIGSLSDGAVMYIAVEGGFDITPILDSCSTYIRGGFGGWQGRALVEGDKLPLRRDIASDSDDMQLERFDIRQPSYFRVILGPQTDYFSDSEITSFLAEKYTISNGSDRMGMRLDGRPISFVKGFNIVSDAIAPGSIQVSGTGLPIVLLADRQTCGGYPKIATVISADLPALGRLPIGAKLDFQVITMEEALQARRKLITEMQTLHDKIVPIRQPAVAGGGSQLFDCNLISGVIDAFNWAI